MKICNLCKTENENDAKFCKKCGCDLDNMFCNQNGNNSKNDLKKLLVIVLAGILIIAVFVGMYDYAIGYKERKATKQLESMGTYYEDKEWYDYNIENILEYRNKITDLEKELKENDFDTFIDRANVAFQIELCNDNLENEISDFKNTYNGLSKKKQEKVCRIIEQKYKLDIKTLLD